MNESSANIPISVYPDPESLGTALGNLIISRIETAAARNKKFLMICPSGRSAASTYKALGRLAAQRESDLSGLVIVMMDEYLSTSGNKCCPGTAHYSCTRFAHENIQQELNKGIPEENRVRLENIWVPDPDCPEEYDKLIKNAGGVDFAILASGASDGHVAFNAPPTGLETNTRIVKLPDSTRRDNLSTFPGFKNLEEVPHYGITIGLNTIASLAKETVLVIHGNHKKHAVEKLVEYKGFVQEWPVSVIFRCASAQLYLDEAARPGRVQD